MNDTHTPNTMNKDITPSQAFAARSKAEDAYTLAQRLTTGPGAGKVNAAGAVASIKEAGRFFEVAALRFDHIGGKTQAHECRTRAEFCAGWAARLVELYGRA